MSDIRIRDVIGPSDILRYTLTISMIVYGALGLTGVIDPRQWIWMLGVAIVLSAFDLGRQSVDVWPRRS